MRGPRASEASGGVPKLELGCVEPDERFIGIGSEALIWVVSLMAPCTVRISLGKISSCCEDSLRLLGIDKGDPQRSVSSDKGPGIVPAGATESSFKFERKKGRFWPPQRWQTVQNSLGFDSRYCHKPTRQLKKYCFCLAIGHCARRHRWVLRTVLLRTQDSGLRFANLAL